MSGGIQYHGGQGFDPAFPGDADRVAGDLDGGLQIQSAHAVRPHTDHLPSWATRSRVYRSVHFSELKSDTCLGL